MEIFQAMIFFLTLPLPIRNNHFMNNLLQKFSLNFAVVAIIAFFRYGGWEIGLKSFLFTTVLASCSVLLPYAVGQIRKRYKKHSTEQKD